MKLALDHHYPTAIAEQLRRGGHDAVAAIERGWHREPDESLLTPCAGEPRTGRPNNLGGAPPPPPPPPPPPRGRGPAPTLLTNNVGDFVAITRTWAVRGQQHAGLIFTSDTSRPRTLAAIGTYVKVLDAFLREHAEPDGFTDRVHWL